MNMKKVNPSINSGQAGRKLISAGLILAMLAIIMGPFAQVAQAAAITSASDTMSSSKTVTASSHKIKFTTPTGAADSTDTIIITFPSTGTTPFNFTGKTISTVTFTHGATTGLENTETLAATPSATVWGAVFSGTQNRILTLTAPTDGIGAAVVAASDKIIITYDNTNSINASNDASPYAIAILGAFNDSGNITVAIIADDVVAVTSLVNQTISFALGANSVDLTTLSTTTVKTGSHTMTIGTNAPSGMAATVTGTTLTSSAPGTPTITACATNCTDAGAGGQGTEQFGINLKDNTTPNVGAEATGTSPIGVAATGYATVDSFKFVSGETIASSSGGINSTVFTISYIANISGATEAGTYTTNLTYTASGNF